MGGSVHGRQRPGRAAVVVSIAVAGLAVLSVTLLVLPALVVDHDLAGASVAAQDRLKAVNDVRTTLLQAVGGMVVLFGAYATWRQLRVSQDGLRATQEGYITDRFSTSRRSARQRQAGNTHRRDSTHCGGSRSTPPVTARPSSPSGRIPADTPAVAARRTGSSSGRRAINDVAPAGGPRRRRPGGADRTRRAVAATPGAVLGQPQRHGPAPGRLRRAVAARGQPRPVLHGGGGPVPRQPDAGVSRLGRPAARRPQDGDPATGPAAFWPTCGAPGWSKPTCVTRTSPRPTCARRTCARSRIPTERGVVRRTSTLAVPARSSRPSAVPTCGKRNWKAHW